MRRNRNKNIDSIVIFLIVFWVAVWGIITIALDWFFEITNCIDNRPAKFLVYLVIAIFTLVILNMIMNDVENEDDAEDSWSS